jgi:hypothetical protein
MASSASSETDAAAESGGGGDLIGLALFTLVPLLLFGLCLRTVIVEHGQAARIEAASTCTDGRTKDCLVRTRGVVDSADDLDVWIRYDDDRQTVGLGSVGDSFPESGTKVLLESWNGAFVSALDPVTERRYRGSHWPKRWNGGAIFGVVAGFVFLVPIVWGLVDELVKTRRPHAAA